MFHHHFSHDLEKEWSKCCTLILIGVDMAEEDDYSDNDEHECEYFEDNEEEEEEKEENDDCIDTVPVINLLPNHKVESPSNDNDNNDIIPSSSKDPWLQGAHTLAESIHQMSSLLQRKSTAYLSSSVSSTILNNPNATMKDNERAMLENTVASFAAATANQIESLRRAAQLLMEDADAGSYATDLAGHRAGIVASLILNLRMDVADCMSKLQKMRKARMKYCVEVDASVGAGESLLQCRLVPSSVPSSLSEFTSKDMPLMTDDDCVADEDEIEEENLFTDIYCKENSDDDLMKIIQTKVPPPPTSRPNMTEIKRQDDTEPEEIPTTTTLAGFTKSTSTKTSQKKKHEHENALPLSKFSLSSANPATNMPNQQYPGKIANPSDTQAMPYNQPHYNPDEQQQQQQEENHHQEELQRESAYLTAKLATTKLNDVQKVEEKMMEITSLLTQFSVMIGNQQEDIMMIHDSATKSKKNVRKGEDQLHDAGKRREGSKHYMAMFIFMLGVVLLFFHSISP